MGSSESPHAGPSGPGRQGLAQEAWTLDRDGRMEAVRPEELPDEPGLRRIVKVTVRTSDASGQLHLEPDASLEG